MPSSPSDPPRPKLLLGFSTAGRPNAEFLQSGLVGAAEVAMWCDSDPAPPADSIDAAAFVLCNGHESAVLFRLGVFLGVLGRNRVVVCPVSSGIELPLDLRDLTVAPLPSLIVDHLRRLATTNGPALSPEAPAGHPARRARRTLGTAWSAQSGQELRIADISLSGALLETFGEIPEGQILDLNLTLDTGRRLRVAAKVVRIQYPQWGRVGGVGVQFLHFEGGSRATLEGYLHRETATA